MFAKLTTKKSLLKYAGIAAVGILILFAAVKFFGGLNKPKPTETTEPRPVKTIVLDAQSGELKRTYAGEIDANLNSELSFRVSGPVIRLPVQAGQSVRKGDLIAEIDPRDYKFNVERLESQLQQMQTQLKTMKIGAREEEVMVSRSKLKLAEAREKLAKSELDRIKIGLNSDVATQSEFDQAQCAYDTAKAETVIARKNLTIAETGSRKEDIEAMDANIRAVTVQLNMAKAGLADTRLLAPFAGVIGKRYIEEHDQVSAGQPIVTLQDNSRMEVVIHVPQNELAATSAGCKMAVRFNQAGPELSKMSFPLSFKEIDTTADSNTRTYRVTLVMETPKDVSVYPGMTVEVDTVLQPAAAQDEGFMVPASAIIGRPEDGQPILWRVNQQTSVAEAVEVKTGQLIGDFVHVTGNLKAGDQIITAGASFIFNGQKVSASTYRYDSDEQAREKQPKSSTITLPSNARDVTFSSYAPTAPYASKKKPGEDSVSPR